MENEKSVENDVVLERIGSRNLKGLLWSKRPELDGNGVRSWTYELSATILASPKRAISGSKLGLFVRVWDWDEMGVTIRVNNWKIVIVEYNDNVKLLF